MDGKKLIEIFENIQDKPNKDLLEAEEFLFIEHESLKKLVIQLTLRMDGIEELHDKITKEIEKRKSA